LNEAQTLFTRAAKQSPKRPTAWEWAGYTALQQNDYTSAIFSLQHAAALEPRSSKVLLNLGKAQFLNGNFADAQATYTSLCEVDPKSADAYYNLGNSCVKLADFTSAVKAYARATQLDPNSTTIPNGLAYVGLGYALVHSGSMQPAQAAFSRALSIDATNVDAATGLALASTSLARSSNTTTAWNAAADALKRATVLAPENSDLQVAYGESLVRSNQDVKAQAVLTKAVATSPNDEVALKLLAKAQQNQGDIVGETNTLARLAAAYPNSMPYQQLLANAQMVQLDYRAAAVTLTTIVHAQPSNLAAAFQLYTALSHTGHNQQALYVLHTASLQPGTGSAKAVIYNALGYETFTTAPKHDHAAVKAAQHYFYEALAADHSSVDAMKGLGVTALKLGAYKHAIAFLSRAIGANSQDAPTYVARGYAYERLQNIKAAIADYRAALQLDPQNAEARADLQRFAVVTKS
jgi:tetratricopeptide (TPR) repeat protein